MTEYVIYIYIHKKYREITHRIMQWLENVSHSDRGFQFSIIPCKLAMHREMQWT